MKKTIRPAIFKWRQTEPEVILCAVRWYLRYSLSFRDVEELLSERGLEADHTTIWRWVQRYGPELEARLRRHLKPTNKSWRVDETCVRVKGRWCYLYRAIDSTGATIDFVLSGLRDAATAKRLFRKALTDPSHPQPRVINTDQAPLYGSAHSNRHLRVFSIVLGVLLLCVTIAVVRLSSVEPPRPIVVRVDEIGRAEALAYEAVEAQADPRDPTTKYFLNRFLHDHFGRRRATAQQYWPRSLRFLSTDLANAAFTANNEEIALLAAGITLEELRVENVVLRIQANPTEPHGAVADFALIRTRQEREVSREAWTATVQFVFMPVIPADLVIFNPMGIQITYLETDRTLITNETP